MNKPLSRTTLVLLVAVLSCDGGSSEEASGAASTDCPIGTFKPEGLTDCVFPAETNFGQPAVVSDNRCAANQPAFPPTCVSDTGRRPYLAATHTCAANYHYEPGVCQRGGVGGDTGTGGFFGTAGTTGTAGFFETAGATSTGGFFGTAGSTVDVLTGEGGATGGGGGEGGATGGGGCGGDCPDAATPPDGGSGDVFDE